MAETTIDRSRSSSARRERDIDIEDTGSGMAGWMIGLLVALALIVGALLLFSGGETVPGTNTNTAPSPPAGASPAQGTQ